MRTITTTVNRRFKAEKKTGDSRSLEISLKLENLFGEVKYDLFWAKARNGKLGVMITYEDFLSVGVLRQMLKSIIPSDIHVNLKREYSDGVLVGVLLDEFKKNNVGVVDCCNGSITAETIRGYVYRRLESVELA